MGLATGEVVQRSLGFCPRCGQVVGVMHTQPECDAMYADAYQRASAFLALGDNNLRAEIERAASVAVFAEFCEPRDLVVPLAWLRAVLAAPAPTEQETQA